MTRAVIEAVWLVRVGALKFGTCPDLAGLPRAVVRHAANAGLTDAIAANLATPAIAGAIAGFLGLATLGATGDVADLGITDADPIWAAKEVAAVLRRLAAALAGFRLTCVLRIDALQAVAAGAGVASFIQFAADAALAGPAAADFAFPARRVTSAVAAADAPDTALTTGAADAIAALAR